MNEKTFGELDVGATYKWCGLRWTKTLAGVTYGQGTIIGERPAHLRGDVVLMTNTDKVYV